MIRSNSPGGEVHSRRLNRSDHMVGELTSARFPFSGVGVIKNDHSKTGVTGWRPSRVLFDVSDN